MTEADKKTLEELRAIERRRPDNWLDLYAYDLFSTIRDNWLGNSTECNDTLLLTDDFRNMASIHVCESAGKPVVHVSTGCMLVKLDGDTLDINHMNGAMVLDDGTYKIPLFP